MRRNNSRDLGCRLRVQSGVDRFQAVSEVADLTGLSPRDALFVLLNYLVRETHHSSIIYSDEF